VLAGRGERGGIRLYSPAERERVEAAIRDLDGGAETPDAGTLDLARWLGQTWEVSIEKGGRLILPEPPRKLGLAPNSGELAVVFLYGGILEIWTLEAWDKFFAEHGPALHLRAVE
jgi:hypothetical protein